MNRETPHTNLLTVGQSALKSLGLTTSCSESFCYKVVSSNQQCVITSRAETYGAIAAHHRASADENTGFSFLRCVINGGGKIFLGRAWGKYSRTIYSYCYIQDIITPLGWSDWNDPSRQGTVVFGQHSCRGRGANTKGWVPWAKTFSYKEVRPFVGKKFINGEQWLNL